MRQLMITIIASACLCAVAVEEGRDLKSLVRPQTFSCELRDVRLTRAIDEMSSGKVTINRGSKSTTTKRNQSDSSKWTVESSSGNIVAHHQGHDTRSGGRFNAEGGLKWGLIPFGSIGGGASQESSNATRKSDDRTDSNRSGTEVSVADVHENSSSTGQEYVFEGSDKSRLGVYRLVFSVVLKNRDVNDELQIDSSRMYAKLQGPGLTGVISVHCSEQGEFTIGADEKSFEFVYPINDERMLNELILLDKRGQLSLLTISKTGADIPVISKKCGTNVLSEQSATERRRPSTSILIELEEFRELPFWRVSRRHTVKSGRRGTFVTLREALQGIGAAALDFSDSLPEQIFVFSEDGSLIKVLDTAAIKKDGDGHYHVLALRLKDNKGKTSLGLPLADRLALNIVDYSEIAIISFTFDEFARWAVLFPDHFAAFRKEIETWLVSGADKKALSEFQKQIEAKQHEEDIRPLHTYGPFITKNDVDRFRERANVGVSEMQFKLGRCLFEGWGIPKDDVEAVMWYRKAAEQGNADGQLCLGLCYIAGIGVTKDELEAVKLFCKAAEQGNADGQLCLGRVYQNGTGVTKDDTVAVKWFRKAAEQGHAYGQFYLGDCYLQGKGVAKNEMEAIRWIRKSAEQGIADVQVVLAGFYLKGTYVARNEAEAVKWFRIAAQQGNAVGQFSLGDCYLKGEGVTKDAMEAFKWFRMAAMQDNADAQNNLGAMYSHGLGVVKDEVEAVKWFRKAAEQGLADAQYNLGVLYSQVNGNFPNELEAVKWFRMAAEQGHVKAQRSLGFMYVSGEGVTKDESEAFRWFHKAAEQGDAYGQFCLGGFYLEGRGVEQDKIKAVKWFRQAAEQGDASGQLGLGMCYLNGEGVLKNESEAVKWLRKAARQGDKTAIEKLGELGKE